MRENVEKIEGKKYSYPLIIKKQRKKLAMNFNIFYTLLYVYDFV